MLLKRVKIIFFYLLFAEFCFATDYYVDDGFNTGDIYTPAVIGNDANNGLTITTPKATIADVLNDYVLGAGDVIYVDAGTYTETGINIGTGDDGGGGTYLIIQGASNSLTIFNTTGTENTFNFATNSVQYVKIMDLQINKGSVTYFTASFTGNGLSYIWFENCVLTQSSNNEIVYGTNASATANSNIKFNNCTFTNSNTSSDADAIELIDNFDNTTISNNTCTLAGTGYCFYMSVTNSSYAISGTTINNNSITMNTATTAVDVIVIEGASSTTNIYSNTLSITSTSASNYGIRLKDGGATTLLPSNANIYSNTITMYGTGIDITGYNTSNRATTIAIYSNTITMSSSAATHRGIMISYAGTVGNGISIYKNKVRSGYKGIDLYTDVSYCTLYNNYISNSAYCLYINNSATDNTDIYFNSMYGSINGMYAAELQSNINIKNNIFYSTSASNTDYCVEITVGTLCGSMNYNMYYAPNGARIGYFAANYTTFANWQAVDKVSGGTLGEENGKNADPKYNNVGSNDLDILDATSQAIHNASVLGGSYTTDIYGTTRSATTPWIGAFEDETILGVGFFDFDVELLNDIVEIDWTTFFEVDNDYFVVEKSNNGIDYRELGIIDGKGYSANLSFYKFIDYTPFIDNNYYRVKQVDFNGEYSFSKIKSVFFEKQLSIYPNPTEDKIYIFGLPKSKDLILNVISSGGTKFNYDSNVFDGTAIVDLSVFSSGIYFLEVIDDEKKWVEKIVKVE